MKNKKNEQQLETTYNFVELASIDQNSSRHILSRDMSEPMMNNSKVFGKIKFIMAPNLNYHLNFLAKDVSVWSHGRECVHHAYQRTAC